MESLLDIVVDDVPDILDTAGIQLVHLVILLLGNTYQPKAEFNALESKHVGDHMQMETSDYSSAVATMYLLRVICQILRISGFLSCDQNMELNHPSDLPLSSTSLSSVIVIAYM